LDEAYRKDSTLIMHHTTVSEVYYDAIRTSNLNRAEQLLNYTFLLPITFIESVSERMIRLIGHFKTTYKISFADSFVLAAAKMYDAAVVTSDRHEFEAIEKSGDISFYWIR
jgi:predicted nucleic acid-binding protein